jgi:hypothetical protein
MSVTNMAENVHKYTNNDYDYLCSVIDACKKLIRLRETDIDKIEVFLSRVDFPFNYKENECDLNKRKEVNSYKTKIENHRCAIEQLKYQQNMFQNEISSIQLRSLIRL